MQRVSDTIRQPLTSEEKGLVDKCSLLLSNWIYLSLYQSFPTRIWPLLLLVTVNLIAHSWVGFSHSSSFNSLLKTNYLQDLASTFAF